MAEVRMIYLPVGERGEDQGVDEYLAAGHTVNELMALRTPDLREPPVGEDDDVEEPDTQSAILVRYAEEGDLFHSPDGEAFATVPVEDHRETHAVRSGDFKRWLLRSFYEEFGKPSGSQALQDALGVVEAKALFDGEEHPVYIRVAEHEGTSYVDLANEAWEAVKITTEGVEVVSDPPVRFRRRKGMLELPHPTEGGKVDLLKRFVNVRDEKDWRLLVAWLVQAFRPTGPYPVLILQGEQGSAKTTLARLLRAIVDPSTAPVRTAPRGDQDLVIAANNSWVVALDNLSGLPPWLSDALCKLSTGGGFSTRTLYTNDEETLFDATRPIILNGITDIATRPDLLDRAIILTLLAIPAEERRPEKELREEFEAALPGILGALLGAVGVAMRELPNIVLPSLPRMADAVIWATAAEGALGMEPGEYMEAYAGGRREVNELALEADPVATAVARLMEGREEWIGTAAQLLKELDKRVDEGVRRFKTWPKQPQHLSRHLKRVAPVLRVEGIEVEDLPRQGSERKKRLFKNKPTNDRHGRHDRHFDPEADKNVDSEGDGSDDDVTATAEEGVGDRHGEKPIETPDSTDRDGGDGGDDELQSFSKGVLVTNEKGLRTVIHEIEAAEVVALDLETTGLGPRRDRIRLLSLATDRGAWLVDNFTVEVRKLFEILKEKTLIVHNAMYDLLFLRYLGYAHGGQAMDTMTLSRMVYAGERDKSGKRLEHSLEACCTRELDLELDKSHQKSDWSGELSEEMLAYATDDTRVLLALHEALEEKLLAAGQERAVEIEERALLSGIEMAHNGVAVDKERWLEIVDKAGEGLGELRARLDDLVGNPPEEIRKRNAKNKNISTERKEKWNWDSPDQIKASAATISLTLEKTNMDYLKLLDHEFARALLDYREIKSGLATYGEKFFEPTEDGREVYLGGRVYPSWGMCQADTGRMSCKDPNMQNVPNKKSRLGQLRSCIVVPQGYRLIKADYSQIELRIVAKVAGEQAMLEAYRAGDDLHLRTARIITGREKVSEDDRQLGKAVNFGLLYGQGAEGLMNYARKKGVKMDLDQATEYRELWFETYPAIRAWQRREGFGFDTGDDSASTLTGRLRRVKSFMEKVNHPVQGTGADGLKLAMALFHERLPGHLDAKLVLAVHDELVIECPEEQAEEVARFVEEVMIDGMDEVVNPGLNSDHPNRVPVEVEAEILKSWGGE